MPRAVRPLLAALLLTVGCAFHEQAEVDRWHGLLGHDGVPVYFMSTTKVGLKLFVVIPLFGNTQIDGMVDEMAAYVSGQGGDHVRIIQADTENYWYGFPPLTWIFTPVVSSIAAEYRPNLGAVAGHLVRSIEES